MLQRCAVFHILTVLHSSVSTLVIHSGGSCLDRQHIGLHLHTPEIKNVPFERQHTTNCLLKHLIWAEYNDSLTFSRRDTVISWLRFLPTSLPLSSTDPPPSLHRLSNVTPPALCGCSGCWESQLKRPVDHGSEVSVSQRKNWIIRIQWQSFTSWLNC